MSLQLAQEFKLRIKDGKGEVNNNRMARKILNPLVNRMLSPQKSIRSQRRLQLQILILFYFAEKEIQSATKSRHYGKATKLGKCTEKLVCFVEILKDLLIVTKLQQQNALLLQRNC